MILGFLASGVFIRDSFISWDDQPTITTLDSIAAPIEDIQFPTVTACNEEYKYVDQWTLLEIILNTIAYECKEENNEDIIFEGYEELPLCSATQKIRQDFEFMTSSTVSKFAYSIRINGVNDLAKMTVNSPQNMLAIEESLADMTSAYTKGELTWEEVDSWLGEFFGYTFTSVDKLIDLKLNKSSEEYYGYYSFYDLTTSSYESDKESICNTTLCKQFEQRVYSDVQALSHMTNIDPKFTFGSSMVNFLQLYLPRKCQKYHRHQYKFFYDFFANLSQSFGFTKDEIISLPEIPLMFETLPYVDAGDLKAGCNTEIYSKVESCEEIWTKFSKNITGTKRCVFNSIKHQNYFEIIVLFKGSYNPCLMKNDTKEYTCCSQNFEQSRKLGNNLPAVMKIMRVAVKRGKSHLNVSELLENALQYINYTMLIDEKDLENLTYEVDYTSMIPWCEIDSGEDGDCTLFDPIVTDQGLCHSFNPTPTLDMLRPSYFSQSFREAFKSDLTKNPIFKNATGSGNEHALTFYLMNDSFRRMLNPTMNFVLKLSTRTDYFDMRYTNQEIKFGYHTTLKVDAMEIISSNDLHKVATEKRNCRFSDETNGLDIFKVYSKSACEFECKIKRAFEVCQCYPWYVPAMPKWTRHDICNIEGNYCFELVTKKKALRKQCTCLPTCHHIEFPFVSYTKELKSTQECNDQESKEYRLARIMLEHGFDSFSYKFFTFTNIDKATSDDLVKWDLHNNTVKLCNKMMKYVAKVTVMFDRNTYIRTQKSLKMTFTDKLAAFGKLCTCLLMSIRYLLI